MLRALVATLALLLAVGARAAVAPVTLEPASLQPTLQVAAGMPALRDAVGAHAGILFHTPDALIDELYLRPAVAEAAPESFDEEGRRVVAGLVASPDSLASDFEDVAHTFGRQAANRLHFAAERLRERDDLAKKLAQVRQAVGLEDPVKAERLRGRLQQLFDDQVRAEAGAGVILDGRKEFAWQSGLRHGEQQEPAKILPFRQREKKAKN